MDGNFSARVHDVIRLSREEALRLGHDYIGTEHILLGIIREAEGIAVKKPGELNFSIVNKYIDDIVLVSDNEIIEGLCFLSKYTDIVPETAGVVSFSAVLFNKLNIKNKKIVCIISGGNISKEDFLKYTEGENG